MFLLRFFFLLCLSGTIGSLSAFALSAEWGETELAAPPSLVKGMWGGEGSSFELAGLFFSGREENVVQKPLPLWLENAVAIPDVDESRPMIALVIDDLGVNRKLTKRVLNLPVRLTAAFLSYADDLSRQTQAARSAGHELLLHAPMEPVDSRFNPGSGALRTEMDEEEIQDRFAVMLDSFSGYVGVNNHMGSRFTADERGMRAVMAEIKKRGLLFLDSLTSSGSVVGKIAEEQEVPYVVRNVFLDNVQDGRAIRKQLELLEKQASKHHFAVGIGHPHKATLEALEKWIPLAEEKGFVFVPVSQIAIYRQDGQGGRE